MVQYSALSRMIRRKGIALLASPVGNSLHAQPSKPASAQHLVKAGAIA